MMQNRRQQDDLYSGETVSIRTVARGIFSSS